MKPSPVVEDSAAGPPDVQTLPLFPLGGVLFPGATLPLHIFEQRYRRMIAACLQASPPEFVALLIKEGDEVMEGRESTGRPAVPAVPYAVGTVARIVEAGQFPDGRYFLVCRGVERVRLRRLTSESPYLEGEVERLVDQDAGSPTAHLESAAGRVREAVRLLLTEVGDALPDDESERRGRLREAAGALPADAAELSHFAPQVLFTASQREKQRLLEAPSIEARLALALPLLEREREMTRRAKALAGATAPIRGVRPPSPN